MIFDRIENIGTYLGTGEAMDAALNFLKVISEEGFDESREYDPGCGVLVRCAAYTTRPLEDCCFEAHRRYIDVMAMLSGTEQIGYKPAAELEKITQEYVEEQDALLAEDKEGVVLFTFRVGDFAVWYPQDGHMPCISSGEAKPAKRLILKVPVQD